MRKFAILAAGALCAITGCASTEEMDMHKGAWATLDGTPPLIIAHRGASGYRPEHTLEAYKLAIDMGADVVEPDLVITKDGVLVARHDRYLSTTTNVSAKPEFADRRRADADPNGEGRVDWWVEDFTLAELKSLRARQPFDGRSRDYDDKFAPPTFEEVLALITKEASEKGRPIGVYPETKHPGFFSSIGLDFKAPLLAALTSFDAGPVFIQSFEPAILKQLNDETDAKLVQLIYEETPGAGPNISLDEIAEYADGVGPSKYLIIPQAGGVTDFVAQAHARSLFVHPWTFRLDQPHPGMLNDAPEDEPAPFFALGVDGVFTDFPDASVKARRDFEDQRQQE